MPLSGCLMPSRLSSAEKRSRSSARSMLSGDVPIIFTPARSSGNRQFERRLPAELNDHAIGIFPIDDVQNLFQGQRLEVELVRSVVIRADSLRVAIDHDGLITVFFERKGGMHAAVIELDALADAIGPAAENHDFLALRRLRLIFAFVSRIEIRGKRFELGAAGIHRTKYRLDALRLS